jgi:hypothetical protein
MKYKIDKVEFDKDEGYGLKAYNVCEITEYGTERPCETFLTLREARQWISNMKRNRDPLHEARKIMSIFI